MQTDGQADTTVLTVAFRISANAFFVTIILDLLCGLVVRVSGYRYKGLGFDSRRYEIF